MTPNSPPRLPVPDLLSAFGWLGRFELLDCIGSGAMGQVWRARERDTEKIVALKMLDPSRVGDEQTLARLDIEAATLMKLREAGSHANVVPILDFKLTESHACLVMEFIPGLNLKKWCEAHRLGLRERVRLIAQVARASGWFHALGIMHRDLKPANILVNAVTHQPVIVDFSIAKLDDCLPITLTNEALGTAPYMAPEQIDRRRGGITPATDVYALGATLYELLTQVPPHPGDLAQVVQRHAEEVRPAPLSALNPEVPRDLECICLKTLSHRPGDRYMDGTELAEDLERFLAGEPVKARPLSLGTRIVRRARRKPALTAALAACLALGVFALWNLRRQEAQRERFALQTQLTTAMQHGTWGIQSLETSEAALAALEEHYAPLAGQVRQRFHDDIVRDVEIKLQQNHLLDEDFTWLRTVVAWLGPRSPAQAGRLQSLITERLGRWETQAELLPPFSDMQGLFTYSHVKKKNDLLYPAYDPAEEPLGAFTITKALSVPMEAACTFVADTASFQSITLVFYNQGSRLALGLHKVRHLSGATLRLMGVPGPDPESYALVLSHDHQSSRIAHIPDVHLLDQPFRLTLRVEREWAEADLNGHSRLRVDSTFALASGQVNNYWRITWPKDVGLKGLILRTRRADAISPLEDADLAAMQGQYAKALHRYEQLRGDPHFGSEASYKIAECHLLQGDAAAALPILESLIQGPPSIWRDRSLIQSWVHSARHQGSGTARYITLLPDPMPTELFRRISQGQINELSQAYAPAGMSTALPQVDVARITEAAKAYRLLRIPAVQSANRFALAHHSARLDQEADAFYKDGLGEAFTKSALNAEDLLAVGNCLDQWCRITPAEKNSRLAQSLANWQKKSRDDPTVQCIWHMEQTRAAARAADLPKALKHTLKAQTYEKADNRVLTSARLLEGMVHSLRGAEDQARSAWAQAREIAATVTLRHPLHLMDCVLLHSLSQSWDLRTLGEVLPNLLTKHLKQQERTAAQVGVLQIFLTDPAWITTFNNVLQDQRGRAFAEDYVLCRQAPRELVLEFYRLLFEHYFLMAAPAMAWMRPPAQAEESPRATPDLRSQPTSEQASRVRGIVDQLVTEMAMNPRGEITHLYAYLRAWNDPAAARSLFVQTYPYSPSLIENLKWLLAMRQRQGIAKTEK